MPSLTVTGTHQYEAWTDRRLPAVEIVRPGVWSIPVPFPDPRTRYTLAYLLDAPDGAVLIDPGMDTEDSWKHLLTGLRATGHSPESITGIVVTHCHPDHLGLAGRLRSASGAWLALGADERHYRPELDLRSAMEEHDRRLRHWGVPSGRREELALNRAAFHMVGSLALPDLRLDDGEVLLVGDRRLQVLGTPGHSPGHICLLDADNGLLFAGDHLLPGIRPHVMLDRRGLADPLGAHLASLGRACLPDVEVLPAHEYRFSGAGARVRALTAWHERRAAEITEVLRDDDPQDVWSVASRLRWSREWNDMNPFALQIGLGETASHLVRLRTQGIVAPPV